MSLTQQQQDQIRHELETGGKIAAVKVYREHANCSLSEAKQAIETLEREWRESNRPPSAQTTEDDPAQEGLGEELLRDIDEAVARGNKLQAVKLYREGTGSSLRAAKEFIEARTKGANLSEKPSAVEAQQSGCFSAFLFVIGLAAGSAFVARFIA